MNWEVSCTEWNLKRKWWWWEFMIERIDFDIHTEPRVWKKFYAVDAQSMNVVHFHHRDLHFNCNFIMKMHECGFRAEKIFQIKLLSAIFMH